MCFTVQLSRFLSFFFISDSFYIISKLFLFVKNFFNFFQSFLPRGCIAEYGKRTRCLLLSHPGTRGKQKQHREQLQAACQHVKHQDIFADGAENTEVAGRPDFGKSRTDVV